MNIQSLKQFLSVVECGSFAAAARASDVDPSQISRTISGLEEDLGIRLFHRTTRSLALTDQGINYYARVRDILDELEAAKEEARLSGQSVTGTLKITLSSAYANAQVIPLLPEFRETWPDIRLELLVTDDTIDLARDGIDLAIRHAPEIEQSVICSKLHDTRYHVVANPEYLSRRKAVEKPADLSDHDLILFDLPDFRKSWLFRRNMDQETIPVQGALVVSSALAIQKAMLDGMGVALLPDWLVKNDLASGACMDLFPDYRVAAHSFETGAWILYPSRKFLPAKTRVMIDFLRRKLGRQDIA